MFDDVINKINNGNFVEAEKILKPLIKKNPKDSKSLYLMGYIYLRTNNFDKSLKFFYQALLLDETIENLFAYAEVLTIKKNLLEAKKIYQKIILKDANNEPGLVNLGYIYFLLKDYENSEKCYLKSLEINSKNPHYYKNLGRLYKRQNKLEKAIKAYKIGLSLDPNNNEIKKGIGLILLSQKQYENAWDYFESRIFSRQNQSEILSKVKNNLFDSKDIIPANKLVVISEQGIGDKILFSSMYSELLNLNTDIKFIIDPRLETIFKRSFGNFEFIHQDNLDRIDELIKEKYKFIYAGTLGKFFRDNINNFNGKSFFIPDQKKVSKYKTILQKYNFKKYIGISWKSSSEFVGHKSFDIDDFKTLVDMKDYGFINLQYGKIDDLKQYNLNNEKKIIQIENLDLFNDLDNLIALISCLDYVITSPNVTIHLAGSVGKKCFALYHTEYDSIFNSISDKNNEWYENLKVIQFNNDLRLKIENLKKLLF